MFKKKYEPIVKYHILQTSALSISMIATVLANIILGIIIRLTQASEYGGYANAPGGGSTDVIIFIHGIIIGLICFGTSFKLAIENGASRKTYFKSMLIVIIMIAFIWAIVSYLLVLLGKVSESFSIFYFLYNKLPFTSIIWFFTLLLLLISLGFFIAIVMKRTSFKLKMIIFPSIIILSAILTLINVLSNNSFTSFFLKLLTNLLGLKVFNGGHFIASSFFFGSTIILLIFSFLLVRRAEIK